MLLICLFFYRHCYVYSTDTAESLKKMLQICCVYVSTIAEIGFVILYFLTVFEYYISDFVTAKFLLRKTL